MIADHLPALQVVLPLLAAPLCALLRRGTLAWALAFIVALSLPFVASALLIEVLANGPISYELGSWPPPYGIEYRVDVVNAFLLILVSGMGAVTLFYARESVAAEVPEPQQPWFYTMFMLSLAGLLGMAITGDVFNVFVFMEISSLSSYVLIALGRDRRALLAAYQYLIMGTIGATFFVIGIGFLYTMTGTLNMVDMASRIATMGSNSAILAGLAFLTVGISLKLALFPLHLWLPNAYAYAPSVATAFISATATKVAIYLLLRFVFSIFGVSLPIDELPLPEVLLAFSVVAIFATSIVAIFQDDVKRMLAYSSVAQIGYITLGIALANQTGLTGGIVHLFNHAVMKGALFLLIGGVALRLGSVKLADLAGLGRRMPLTMAGVVIGGLSLLGTPLTVGFVSKWYLVLGAIELGYWWLVALIVAGSLLALVYMGRIVEVAYFRPPSPLAEKAVEAPLSMLAPALLLAGACVYFGIDTSVTVEVAARAAQTLLRGLP
ncbi:MAG: monovalent cation/H+ antiporter subunit D family protein [Kiloniellales bacterium]